MSTKTERITQIKENTHMYRNASLTTVALAVLLSFGLSAVRADGRTSAERNCGGLQAATPAKEAVVVTRVACDSEYGREMEAAILDGNLKQVHELPAKYGYDIDHVIAVGEDSFVELSKDTCLFGKDEDFRFLSEQHCSSMGGFSIYGGEVSTGLDSANLYRMKERIVSRWNLYPVQGKYYSFNYNKLLGTPLMIAVRAGRKNIVKDLLESGANPNVFIAVADYSLASMAMARAYNYSGAKMTGPWACKRSRTYLCALLDCYMVDRGGRDEIAKMLIDYGAGFIDDADDYGRNMLWDVARMNSPYLLAEMAKRGFDVKHEDNQGNTVLDCCLEAGGSYYNRFMGQLERLGVKRKSDQIDGNEGPRKPVKLVSGPAPMPSPVYSQGRPACPQLTMTASPHPQKPDNSVEIAALQHRLLALRMELEDARANRKLATVQGTGWVTASMHEQQIMLEISDCERRIMELR